MMKRHFMLVVLLLASAAWCRGAEPAASAPAAGTPAKKLPASVAVEDGGTGPYKAFVVGDESLPDFAIYRPQDLSSFGKEKTLPVVLWGNGGGANDSGSYKNYLTEIASHGFIVIAIGPYELLAARNQGLARKQTRSAQLLQALDWITAQNKKDGSPYKGKINTGKVAVMGHSLGGLQAMEVSADPRISATALCDSGIFNSAPQMNFPQVSALTKKKLEELHAPILYLLGGPGDMAYPNGTDDYARITKVPAALVSQDVGHGGTYGARHGGAFGVATVAWLKWQLNGDAEASKMFIGGVQSGLYKNDPKWKVEVKNLK